MTLTSLLLAWEAADEYLLQQPDDAEISGPVLILNDTFGALGLCAGGATPYSSDSYLSSWPRICVCRRRIERQVPRQHRGITRERRAWCWLIKFLKPWRCWSNSCARCVKW